MVCQRKGRIHVTYILLMAGLGGFVHSALAIPAWEKPDLVLKACRGKIEEAHVSWWGFDAQDSTEFIQSAITSGVRRLVLDRMPSPWVSRPLVGVSNQEIVIAAGAEIQALRGAYSGVGDCLFTFENVENVKISGYGAIVRMWAGDYLKPPYSVSEWRHAFSFKSCSNVLLEGCTIIGAGGDGVYVGAGQSSSLPYCKDVTIRDVVADGGVRQGISVISVENMLIENVSCINTKGRPPESGIDFEPNRPEQRLAGIKVRKCTFSGNVGDGISMALQHFKSRTMPISVEIEDCRFEGNNYSIRISENGKRGDFLHGNVSFKNCAFLNARYSAIYLLQKPKEAFAVSFTGCVVSNACTKVPDMPDVLLGNRSQSDPSPDGISFGDLQIVQPVERSPFGFVWNGWTTEPVESITGVIDVKNPEKRVRFEIDDQWRNTVVSPRPAGPAHKKLNIKRLRVVDAEPGVSKRLIAPKVRDEAVYVFYADRARRICLQGEMKRIKRPKRRGAFGEARLTCREISGNWQHDVELWDGNETIALDVPRSGFYALDFSARGVIMALVEADVPVALMPRGNHSLHLHRFSGALPFYVGSGGAARFYAAGDIVAERVCVTLSNPEGRQAAVRDSILTGLFIDLPQRGMWQVRLSAPTCGSLEDYHMDLFGTPPCFFLCSDRYWIEAKMYSVIRCAEVPRLAVNGVPCAGTAVMPSPNVPPGKSKESLAEFARQGVMLSSDIWTMNGKRLWWRDEGVYDFDMFDSLVHGLLEASDMGVVFPRIKLDPPDNWIKAHPEEMFGGTVRPESIAWRSLYQRMLRDMIAHVDASPYAERIAGYQLGALHCGEWVFHTGGYREGLPEVKWDERDPLPPEAAIADRRRRCREVSQNVAQAIVDAAKYLRELTQGRKWIGSFMGYTSFAHESLFQVLDSGMIDFCAAPPHYGRIREVGQTGRSQAPTQGSFRLHNCVYFEESDFRTFLSDPQASVPPRTRRRPLDESVSIMRRTIGKCLAGGWENWWFLLGGNKTFSDPLMLETVRRGVDVERATLSSASWQPADVAVFTSFDDYATSAGCQSLELRTDLKMRVHTDLLPRCGIAFDSYVLEDIANPNLPDYRIYYFPNAMSVDTALRAKIKERVRQAGKTAIWSFAPGYYDGTTNSVELIADLTGLALNEHYPVASDTYARTFTCRNPTVESDGWTSVYLSMPSCPDDLRKAFRAAGAHVWASSSDVMAIGRGFVMIHASSDGEKEIRLPERHDVVEIFGSSPERRDVANFTEMLKKGETRVYQIM